MGRIPGFSGRQGKSAACCKCKQTLSADKFRKRSVSGHSYLRSECKECEKPAIRKAVNKWQANNPERLRRTRAEWAANNKDKVAAHYRRWFVSHPEYRQTDTFKQNHLNGERRRKARKLSVEVSLTTHEWRELIAEYDGRCAYCFSLCSLLTQDHVVPLSKGGAHTKDNVVPACQECNLSKRDKPVTSWLGVKDLGRVTS